MKMKKIFLIILITAAACFGQGIKFGEAKGLFMSVGVGPKFPINDFGDRNNIGVGFDVTLSYTDNQLLPVFFYSTLGYQHYPGRQDLYKKTDYSSFSTNALIFAPGVRYYFPPLLENIVLLMPIADVGLEFGYLENSHQFKLDANKVSFVEDKFKVGFHLGAGFSMFMLDVITYYNYLPNNVYISFVFKANIPIFVNM